MPAALTPLVGRERELALAEALLRRAEVRLLTITGPGGIGKTRLAIEVGRAGSAFFPDGVVFVPLAVLSDPEGVPTAIVRALGATDVIGIAGREHLNAELRDAKMLLILDNFEHLLQTAPLLTDVLAACPDLKIVTTSRALLRVAGEYALPTPPLDFPNPRAVSTFEAMARSPAIQLFADRARAVAPTFELSPETAPVAADICRHFDGLPLAIELAAAQVVVLPPSVILSRIQARLPLPLTGPRDAPARLRSTADAAAWSYDLLTADEQRLFRRLSVFTGGFALDAAEAVCGRASDGEDDVSPLFGRQGGFRPAVLDGLASLVEKSLLRQAAWEGEARFDMLEMIRSFAWDRLAASGEEDAIRDAHASWVLALAEPAELAPALPGRDHLLHRLEVDQANVLAALEWLDRRGQAGLLLRLTAALSGFWLAHGHFRVGRDWLARALARPSAESKATVGRAQIGLGRLLSVFGESRSADELLTEGIAAQRPEIDGPVIAFALVRQASVAIHIEKYERAEDLLHQALAMAPAVTDSAVAATITGTVLANLGIVAQCQGNLDLAQTRCEDALRIYQELGHAHGVSRALRDLGDLSRDRGDYASSLVRYRESVSLLGEQTDVQVVADALVGLAPAAMAWRLPAHAARLLGAAEALREQHGGVFLFPVDRSVHERTLAAIRAALDEAAVRAAWQKGRRLSVAEAIAEIQALAPNENAIRSAETPIGVLSPRETEILRFLVAGSTDREIAETLVLSVRTVESHVARVLIKLGVRSRTAAVTAALAAGVLAPEAKTSTYAIGRVSTCRRHAT